MQNKRIFIVTGHYGSGKTNFSVNFAIDLASQGRKVCLVDLDIVNPYFRSSDVTGLLESKGIHVIAPLFAGTTLDTPAISPEISGVLQDTSVTVVMDVGGDDVGATALGRFSAPILSGNDYRHFYVINSRRILTQSPSEAVEILREIESSCHIGINAVINNSNLGTETNAQIVLSSLQYADEVSKLSGLPVDFTVVREDLIKDIDGKVPNVYPVKIYVKTPWGN